MIASVDKVIERFLKSALHANRNSFIEQAMSRVEETHRHLTAEQTAELRLKMQDEIVRIYPIVDSSILRANILKARYYFWFVTAVATLYVGCTKGFSANQALNLFAPLAASIPVWLASWGTIPIFYNQRIEGAMNSVIAKYMQDIARLSSENAPASDTATSVPEVSIVLPTAHGSTLESDSDEETFRYF